MQSTTKLSDRIVLLIDTAFAIIIKTKDRSGDEGMGPYTKLNALYLCTHLLADLVETNPDFSDQLMKVADRSILELSVTELFTMKGSLADRCRLICVLMQLVQSR